MENTRNTATKSPFSASLAGHSAIVTGGGRGIGAAVAERLLSRGARVFLCARTASELTATIEALRESFGPAAVAGRPTDLADPAVIRELFEDAEKFFGEPARILVNNAAIGYAMDFLATPFDEIRREWDQMQAINVRAPFLLSHEFMRRADKRGGSIVNLGSLGGIRSTDKFPGLTAYVASKFAVAGLTEALAVEGRPIGVRVNAVAPGAVDTEMLRRAAPHLKTNTRPGDVAKVIAYLCDPAESGAVTGTVIEIHSNL